MPQEIINVGTSANDNTGDTARAGMVKVNNNFTELYDAIDGLAIGTDVQAYDADLAAVAALATNGIVARTGAGTVAARSIAVAGGLGVTNGDGVAGNPTLTTTTRAVTSTVAATGATETFDTSSAEVFDCTMDQACEFTFGSPAASGTATAFVLILRGAFTPTFPASVDWAGSAPSYTTPSVYVFMTVNGGTVWLGQQVGAGFA